MMITFKQFLAEAVITPWQKDELTAKEAIAFAEHQCSGALALARDSFIFYRGDKSFSKPSIVDPATGSRSSQDGDNIYQSLMDASTELKDFPKRTSSLIFTNDKHIAAGYRNICVVLPVDDADVCFSKYHDFWAWEAQPQKFGNLYKYNNRTAIDLLSSIVKRTAQYAFMTKKSKWSIDDIDSMMKQDPEKAASFVAQVIIDNDQTADINLEAIEHACRVGFCEIFGSAIFTKANSGFELVSLNKAAKKKSDEGTGNEMWTNAMCLVIPTLSVENQQLIKDLGIVL